VFGGWKSRFDLQGFSLGAVESKEFQVILLNIQECFDQLTLQQLQFPTDGALAQPLASSRSGQLELGARTTGSGDLSSR
jgi:hypothetical protein